MASHEEFLELCAVSVSGELTGEERKRLGAHLANCVSCSNALKQFKLSAKATVPAAASELSIDVATDFTVDLEKAESTFFARFDKEGGFRAAPGGNRDAERPLAMNIREHKAPSGFEWGQLLMPFAAIILLGLALGVISYRVGIKKGSESVSLDQNDRVVANLEERLSDAAHEQEQFQGEIASRDKSIADLRKQIQELSAVVSQKESGTNSRERTADRQGIETATAKMVAAQQRLDAEEQERSGQAARAAELEAKVEELSKQLQESQIAVVQQKKELDQREGTINRQEQQLDERQATIGRQQELLAHDRDVRDVMGARDLYVVDVYDVLGTGETNKPYGRLFFTKGQKILFYAYDLDQAPGVKRASTFQAWGQRGPDKQNAVNLGIFYEDSAAKKRWVLKSNDAKTLAEISAIFVTVEPDANSHNPRGKEVLYAFLRVEPNHP
jgi:peptidoglycan hydrolase CwlO-like protein